MKVYTFLLMLLFSSALYAQKVVVKSNLLYDATATLNVGAEVGLSKRTTLDVSYNLHAWEPFASSQKMKHWAVQPEFRYWFCERFMGHFMGLHVHGGQFNWGGMLPFPGENGKMFGSLGTDYFVNHRYEGWFAGAGLAYGYHWILSPRWTIEASLGLGYAYLNYDKFKCATCAPRIGQENKHYVGPTKLALSLVYVIK